MGNQTSLDHLAAVVIGLLFFIGILLMLILGQLGRTHRLMALMVEETFKRQKFPVGGDGKT